MNYLCKINLNSSFNLKKNISNICDLRISEGKSGSFFFFTHDNRFIIKTISDTEFNKLKNDLIPSLYNHVMENNNTMLTRIYGLYTLDMGLSKITIILMENIAPINNISVIRKYDLKGSLIGRQTKQLNLSEKTKTLKDKDFIDLKSTNNHFLNFENKNSVIISETLQYDIEILRNANIMDYSFFITVAENNGININQCLVNNRQFFSKDLKYIYFLGIIDYLTVFDKLKKMENTYKSLINYTNRNTISAVNPVDYSNRFYKFILREVLNIKN